MKIKRIPFSKELIIPVITGLVLLSGIYFRSYTLNRNIEKQNERVARVVLFSRLRDTLRQNIQREFPEMPDTERRRTLDQQFQELIRTEKENIAASKAEIMKGISPFRFYLYGADSYYYYDLTKRLILRGRIADRYERGQHFDPKMNAPHGQWRHIELHPFSGYLTYQAMRFLGLGTDPMRACAVSMLILFAITGAVFTVWLLKAGADPHVTLISGVFFSLSPIFLQRSYAGWYDTDIYNILFPLLAIIFLKKILDNGKRRGPVISLAGITAAFAVFWEGWLFLAVITHLILLGLIIKRKVSREDPVFLAKSTALYSGLTLLFASVLITPHGVFGAFANTLGTIKGFLEATPSVWPNLFLMVGELRATEARKVFHMLGGHFFVISAAMGLLLLVFKRSSLLKGDTGLAVFGYTLLILPMALSAERFVLFLHLPASICFAAFFHEAIKFIRSRYSKHILAAAVCGLYMTIAFPVFYGHSVAQGQLPLFNRVWEEALHYIRDNSREDTIVNSWWPPGHFIKAIAERPVTFDGATIDARRGYWIASALMSTDETRASGILRMLNASGLEAFDTLIDAGLTEGESAALIKSVAPLTRENALKEALKVLPSPDAEKFVSLTHAKAHASFVLLYKDLAESSLGLRLVSNWDLRQAAEERRTQAQAPFLTRLMRSVEGRDIERLWELAGRRTYIGDEIFTRPRPDNKLRFDNGLEIDLDQMTARLHELEGEVSGIPVSLLFPRADTLEEKFFASASVNLSVLLIPQGDGSFSSITAPRDILRSMLFRLYYTDAVGLELFEKSFSAEEPILDTKIKIFEPSRN